MMDGDECGAVGGMISKGNESTQKTLAQRHFVQLVLYDAVIRNKVSIR
jgi:hypothetical protein